MSDDRKTSPQEAGEILLHAEPAPEVGVRGLPEEWAAAIAAQLAQHLAAPAQVLRDPAPELVQLDVLVVPPGEERDYHVLVTSGASAAPMTVPAGVDVSPYVELAVLLPETWPLDEASLAEPRWSWPVWWLRTLARLPHRYRTWIGSGHTIPGGQPPRPLGPGTELTGMLLLPSVLLPEELRQLRMPGGATVDLFTLWPLHTDEMELKLCKGIGPLFELLEKAEIDDVIDPARRSVVRKPTKKKRY
jgi:suppressor of fused protein SUFU